MNIQYNKTVFLLFTVTAMIALAIGFWIAYGNYTENRADKAEKNTQASGALIVDTQIENTNSSNNHQTVKSALFEYTQSGKTKNPRSVAADNQQAAIEKIDGQASVESVQIETMDDEQLAAKIGELSLEIEELFAKAEWLKERGYDDEAMQVLFQALELQGLSLKMSLRLESLEDDRMAQRPDQRALADAGREQNDDLPTEASMENDATRALGSQIQFLNAEALRLGAIAEALTEQGDHTAAREFTIMAMEYQAEALKVDIQLEVEKNEQSDENRPLNPPVSIPIDEAETYVNEADLADVDSDPTVAHLYAAKQNLRNDTDYYYQKAELLSDLGDEEGVRKMTFLAIENQIDADLLQLKIDEIYNNNALQSSEISSLGRQD